MDRDRDRGRVLFDASAYMLFEASGDSEVECVDGTIAAESELESDVGAEDDAQSCSYGSLPDSARVHEIDGDVDDGFHNYCADFAFAGAGEYFIGEEDEEEDCEDDDGVVDQCCGGCVVAPPARSSIAEAKKSKGCEDSKVKVLKESERDKLFWENCLAS